MRFHFLIVLLVLAVQPANAQSYQSDIRAVMQSLSVQPVKFDVEYRMYSAHTSDQMIQQMKASVFLWGRSYRYSTDEVLLLNTGSHAIAVNHKMKIVTLNRRDAKSSEMMKKLFQGVPDSLLSRLFTFTLISDARNERIWRLDYNKPVAGLKSSVITLDLEKKRITRIVLYYIRSFKEIYGQTPKGTGSDNQPRLEIAYSHFAYPDASERRVLLDESAIIKRQKRKFTLTQPYQAYSFSNLYSAIKR